MFFEKLKHFKYVNVNTLNSYDECRIVVEAIVLRTTI
jgi:hypothetical protein